MLLFAIVQFVAYIISKNIIIRLQSDILFLLHFKFGQQNKIKKKNKTLIKERQDFTCIFRAEFIVNYCIVHFAEYIHKNNFTQNWNVWKMFFIYSLTQSSAIKCLLNYFLYSSIICSLTCVLKVSVEFFSRKLPLCKLNFCR